MRNNIVNMIKKEEFKFIYFDALFLIFFISVFFWILVDKNMISVLLPIFFIFNGFLFISSKRLKAFSFTGKIFYWISMNLFLPKTEHNYIICGIIFIALGLIPVFFFKNKNFSLNEFQDWWFKDPIFWVIIVLLVFFGLYKSKFKKKIA